MRESPSPWDKRCLPVRAGFWKGSVGCPTQGARNPVGLAAVLEGQKVQVRNEFWNQLS